MKLFCLPYAGASANIYNKWKFYRNDKIEIIPIELAGRGKRHRDPLYTSFDSALSDVFRRIRELISDNDYALFGHSMGGLFAYELYFRITESSLPKPAHICISSKLPPHLENNTKKIHNLPADEFKREIMLLGGTEIGVLDNRELWEYYEPVLRADFRVLETYYIKNGIKKIDSDLTVLYGTEDRVLRCGTDDSRANMYQWRDYCTKTFRLIDFKGSHFYINCNASEIIDNITNTCVKNIYE